MMTQHEKQAVSQSYLLDSNLPARPLIRTFQAGVHSIWVQELWKGAMHARWSISDVALQSVLAASKLVLIAEQGGVPLGIGAVDYDTFGEAGLIFLIVEPAWQRRGIGTLIVEALEYRLRSMQISVLRLGAVSTAAYLWPGLPIEADAAWPFFVHRGWRLEEGCDDLVRELGAFESPSWLVESLESAGVKLRLCSPALRTRVAEFETAVFPVWARYFRQNHPSSESDDRILIAQDAAGELVGTLLLEAEAPCLWNRDEGVRIGSVNALGVAPKSRQQGIGLALAARAMEILQGRGCAKCYIQWTGLAAWYGKLGTSVWARYRMAKKLL